MMVRPDVQMLDVLHGDRFRRLTPHRRLATSGLASGSVPAHRRPTCPAAAGSTADADMHVQPVLNSLRASLIGAGALAGSDPTVDAAIAQVLDALGPALRVAAIELPSKRPAKCGRSCPTTWSTSCSPMATRRCASPRELSRARRRRARTSMPASPCGCHRRSRSSSSGADSTGESINAGWSKRWQTGSRHAQGGSALQPELRSVRLRR